MNKWTNRQMDQTMKKKNETHEQMDGWMDGQIDRLRLMDRQLNSWTDAWDK